MTVRVVVVGDVGPRSGEFHVGDEAMTEAVVDELAQRGVEVSAIVSAAPDDTAVRYGVSALHRLGFDDGSTPTRADREARLREVLTVADSGHSPDAADPAAALVAAIAGSDGLVIAGGGNQSSLWPEHVYERNALAAIASVLGKPVVVSGQTLGPALTERDGELVAETLSRAALVGVRERESLQVARDLGVAPEVLRLTTDDAIWLRGEQSAASLPTAYCVVTVAPYAGLLPPDLLVEAIARLLDGIVESTDLDIVLVPHLGTLAGGESSDQLIHRQVAASMSSDRVHVLGVLPSRQVASISRAAQLSVSTRYHPAVFASAAGVPTVAVSVDDYTSVKLQGALEHVGLAEFAVPSTSLASGHADAVVASAWKNRARIRKHLAGLESALRAASAEWWDDAVAALRGETPPPRAVADAAQPGFLPADLAATTTLMLRWQRAEVAPVIADRLAREVSAPAEGVSDEVLELERRVGAAQASLADYAQRVLHAEVALDAARALAAEVAEPHFEQRLGDARISTPATELEALLNTRTFRWTAGARRVYGRARAVGHRVVRPFRR